MKKSILLMIYILAAVLFAGCSSEQVVEKEKGQSDSKRSVELEDYAIYASVMTEKGPKEKNPYRMWETNIHLEFPQFYYSRDYKDMDKTKEVQINKLLFSECVREDTSDLLGRENTDLKERNADYIITLATEDMFSIRYESAINTVERYHNFCNGITINTHTGEAQPVSDFLTIDETILAQIENDEIRYSETGYTQEEVLDIVKQFIEDYQQGLQDEYNCFYLEEDSIYLIVPVAGGNMNYFTLEITGN